MPKITNINETTQKPKRTYMSNFFPLYYFIICYKVSKYLLPFSVFITNSISPGPMSAHTPSSPSLEG